MSSVAPELLCFQYRGILAPWEIAKRAKRFAYKCKKYARWDEVLIDNNSQDVLRSAGDMLLDDGTFDISQFGHICLVWERVQRWPKDKAGFSLEPDELLEYEQLARIVRRGSSEPNIVDGVLGEHFGDVEGIALGDRWTLFLAVCLWHYFESGKRLPDEIALGLFASCDLPKSGAFALAVGAMLVRLYDALGFVVDANDALLLFVEELGLPDKPENEIRSAKSGEALPKVWIESWESNGPRLIEVCFVEGAIVLRMNRRHPALGADSPVTQSFGDDVFWQTFGLAFHVHLGQIEEIQEFLDSWGAELSTEVRREQWRRAL